MTQVQQPEALRLVEWIESDMSCDGDADIVAELLRQHARIVELEEQLAAIEADRQHNGDPVAWVTADTVDGQTVNGKTRRIWWENNEGVGIPIYAAPPMTQANREHSYE